MSTNLPGPERNERFHIVLVEPQNSLNIGSVARAMMNLDFRNLHLVAPQSFDIQRASITGRWATGLLEQARIHDGLDDAIGEMEEVVGFSSYQGPNRGGQILLGEWMDKLRAQPPHKTALLFGAEDNGLSPAQMDQCKYLVRIPSSAEYGAFNLAQAVLLVLFELSKANWHEVQAREPRKLPTWNEYQQLDRIMEEVLLECGFFRRGSPLPIPALVKNLMRRLDLDMHEMGVLLALFNRIRTTLIKLRGAPDKPS